MENYNAIIANNLKLIRKKRQLSLDKVSALTTISKSMLSQIEKGEANPSISTLWKLANGLKISFTELMNAPESETELIRSADRVTLLEDDGRFRNTPMILFDAQRRFETYIIEIDPTGNLQAEPHPVGTQEVITVSQGNLKMQINEQTYLLEQGDTLRFLADVTHSYANIRDELCRLNMIIYYPANQ